MSYFNFFIAENNIDKKNLRSFRELRLTDLQYEELKQEIKSNRSLNNLDPRDCALYYAFWWQKEYNGESPSSKMIFNSLGIYDRIIDSDDFYKHAKVGAKQLRVKWIKKQNTLFFRTLLLQGGLPINHIKNNTGNYYRFLSRILELKPESIDDFAFDRDITNILPTSSQNEIIYESCLEIVQAIWNDDSAFNSFFEQEEDIQKIIKQLKKQKSEIKPKERKNSIKGNWLLQKNENILSITLNLKIPLVIERELFVALFEGLDIDNISGKYYFYVNETLVCEFASNMSGNFNTSWYNSEIIWDGKEIFPEVFITDNTGKTFNNSTIISTVPSYRRPTLWSPVTEEIWFLEKGNKTKAEIGLLLFNDEFTTSSDILSFSLNNFKVNYLRFDQEVILHNNNQNLVFKTGQPAFEYSIYCNRPKWILRSNICVTSGKPTIYIFNENGQSTLPSNLEYRQNDEEWKSIDFALPIGLLELKISHGDLSEQDFIFNIGVLSMEVSNSSMDHAVLNFTQHQFSLSFAEHSLYSSLVKQNRSVSLDLKDGRHHPKSIKCKFKIPDQRRALIIEIVSPFCGLEIFNSDNSIVENNGNLLLSNLYGLRILNNTSSKVFVRMFNSQKEHIKIIRECQSKSIPVNTFLEDFNKLFLLSDALSPNSEIRFQLCTETSSDNLIISKDYIINRYSNSIKTEIEEGLVKISYHQESQNNLYAIPLDCDVSLIDVITINLNEDGKYLFENVLEQTNNYIIFADILESNDKVLPLFLSVDVQNVETDDNDRLQRIETFREILMQEEFNGENWQKFVTYFILAKSNDLPFSTFDILKTVTISQEIAAKAFFTLRQYLSDEEFLQKTLPDFENDLGFEFLWISKSNWEQALAWTNGKFSNFNDVGAFISNTVPSEKFMQLSLNYFYNIPLMDDNFHVLKRIQNLRMNLGVRVLNEIPQKCPKISDINKNIIQVDKGNARVKILLKAPVAVAQSISDKSSDIWDNTPAGDSVRRNIKYSYELHPEWFADALLYSLNKIQ